MERCPRPGCDVLCVRRSAAAGRTRLPPPPSGLGPPPRSRRLPSAHAALSVPPALSSSPPSASREPSPSLEKRRSREFRRARTRAASSSAPRPPGAVWVVWAVEAAARLPGRVPCGEEEEGEEQPALRQRSAGDSSTPRGSSSAEPQQPGAASQVHLRAPRPPPPHYSSVNSHPPRLVLCLTQPRKHSVYSRGRSVVSCVACASQASGGFSDGIMMHRRRKTQRTRHQWPIVLLALGLALGIRIPSFLLHLSPPRAQEASEAKRA